MLTSTFSLTCSSAICSWSFLKLGNVFCCWIFITLSFKWFNMLVHDINPGSIHNNTIKITHLFRFSKLGCKVNRI